MLEDNKEAWSEYCMKHKLLKENVREKRRILNEPYMQSINKSYRKKRANFGNLYIQNNLVVVRRKNN